MCLSVRFGVVTLALVSMIGCAQSKSNELSSPTAPGSLSEALPAGPGAGYNASGTWNFVVNTPRSGDTEVFDTVFNQDSAGNITFVEPEGGLIITLTRLGPGNGRTIAYRVSAEVEASPCNFEISGTATIDTKTNTGRAQAALVGDDCERFTQSAVFTKK